jgi:hypothetical protein
MNKLCFALILVAVVSQSPAQRPDSFDLHASNFQLLQDDGIRKHLKVTEAQRARMNQHAERYNARINKLRESVKGKNPPRAEQEKIGAQITGMLTSLKGQVLGELSAAQLRRLRQISLQSYGLRALADEVVSKRVGLSSAQLTQVRTRLRTAAEQVLEIEKKTVEPIAKRYQAKSPKSDAERKQLQEAYAKEVREAGAKTRPRVAKIEQDTAAAIRRVMTAAQRKSWESLLGQTYRPA